MLACFFAQIHTGCIFLECLIFVTGFRTALIKSNFDIRAALDTLVEITACFTEKKFVNVKPTPWLMLLLVLGKSRVKQNSC